MRYKLAVVAAVSAFAALGAVAAVATVQARVATEEAGKARWSRDFLMTLFDEADPWRNQQKPITANEIAATAVDNLLNNTEDLAPETRGTAASILARVEGRLGHFESSETLLNFQIELLEQNGGSDTALAAAFTELGGVLTNQARNEAAIDAYRRAHELKPLDAGLDYVSVSTAIELAYALTSAEVADESGELLTKLFASEGDIGKLERSDYLLARLYNTQSLHLQLTGDYAGSLDAGKRAIEFAKTAGNDAGVIVGKTLLGLSEALHQRGENQVALGLDRQVVDIFTNYYGEDHIQTLESEGRLAVSLSNLGRMEDAIAEYQHVLDGQIAALGRDNQFVAATIGNIGAAYLALGDSEKALQFYAEAEPIWESIEPALPIYVAINSIGVARSLQGLGRLQESDEAFSKAIDLLANALGRDHPLYFRAQVLRIPLLIDTNRLDEAAEILPGAYEAIRSAYGEDSKHAALAGLRWAQVLAMTGHDEQAAELAKKSVDVFDTDANRRRNSEELAEARAILMSAN